MESQKKNSKKLFTVDKITTKKTSSTKSGSSKKSQKSNFSEMQSSLEEVKEKLKINDSINLTSTKENIDLNDKKEVSNFFYTLHLMNLVTKVVSSVILTSYDKISLKISQSDLLKVFKNKSFLRKTLIEVFNEGWSKYDTPLLEKKFINMIFEHGKFKHEFCCYLVMFEISQEILSSILDYLKIEDLNNHSTIEAVVMSKIDSLLSVKYDSMINRKSTNCICGINDDGEIDINFDLN